MTVKERFLRGAVQAMHRMLANSSRKDLDKPLEPGDAVWDCMHGDGTYVGKDKHDNRHYASFAAYSADSVATYNRCTEAWRNYVVLPAPRQLEHKEPACIASLFYAEDPRAKELAELLKPEPGYFDNAKRGESVWVLGEQFKYWDKDKLEDARSSDAEISSVEARLIRAVCSATANDEYGHAQEVRFNKNGGIVGSRDPLRRVFYANDKRIPRIKELLEP